MSEKPFYITDTGLGLDTVSDEMYSFGDEEDFCRLFDKLNEQQATISQLKEENVQLQKEKINIEYAEQIVEENQQLRIAKNDLRIENEQLHLAIDDLLSHTSCDEIKKENEQLRKQVKSLETTSDATSNYNAHLESKITTLEKENEQLQKVCSYLKKENQSLIDNIFDKIYIFGKYPFFDGGYPLFMSFDYENVKEAFDNEKKEEGYGYYITKYSLNTPLQPASRKTIKHIEIDYDGQIKELEW